MYNISFLGVEAFIFAVLISDVSSVKYTFLNLVLTCNWSAHLVLSGEKLEGLYTTLSHISKNSRA